MLILIFPLNLSIKVTIYIINFINEEKVTRKKNKPLFNIILSSEEDNNENFDKNFSSLTLQEKPKLKNKEQILC